MVVNANDVVLVTEAEPLDAVSGGPKVIYVNPAFTRMTGYEPDEIIGLTPRILQSERTDRAELDRLRAALLAWEPVEVELLNVHKDGREFLGSDQHHPGRGRNRLVDALGRHPTRYHRAKAPGTRRCHDAREPPLTWWCCSTASTTLSGLVPASNASWVSPPPRTSCSP